jgi:hypothetical protein
MGVRLASERERKSARAGVGVPDREGEDGWERCGERCREAERMPSECELEGLKSGRGGQDLRFKGYEMGVGCKATKIQSDNFEVLIRDTAVEWILMRL